MNDRIANAVAVSTAGEVTVGPHHLDTEAWTSERLYAAALATCLHRALVLMGSSADADLTGARVEAEVSLAHEGKETYSLGGAIRVALPNVDTERRQPLLDQAVHHCPLSGGWEVTLDGSA